MNNFTKRVIVGIIGIPIMLGAALTGGIWFLILSWLIALGIIIEFYRLAGLKGANPVYWMGIIGMSFILLFFIHKEYLQGKEIFHFDEGVSEGIFGFLLVILIAGITYELLKGKGSPFMNLGVTAFGAIYVGIGIGTFIAVRGLFQDGMIIVLILVTIWVCDTAAYLGGKSLGRRPLFPSVSPNKTVEGAIFGLLFALITSLLFVRLFTDFIGYSDAVIVGLIVGIVGQVGDLVESRFKRDAGVKDSSSFFPGHGGFLDRFDSILFVSPVIFLYVYFII